MIDEYRKLALLIASNLKESEVHKFVKLACEREGSTRVKEFMEIQLMHSMTHYHNFITFFEQNFSAETLKLPPISRQEQVSSGKKKKHYQT